MSKSRIAALGFIVISFVIGVVLYSRLPEMMVTHWDAAGEANGEMGKFWGTFLMPLMIFGLFLLFIAIPYLDPLRKNIDKFLKFYDGFILLMVGFMFYVHVLTLMLNLGYVFNLLQWATPAFALLFYYMGVLLLNAKRNWFVGIRTPWTLSSDIVWDKTHQLGGKLFKVAGAVSLLGLIWPFYEVYLLLVPAVGFSIFLVIYSYFEFRKYGKQE